MSDATVGSSRLLGYVTPAQQRTGPDALDFDPHPASAQRMRGSASMRALSCAACCRIHHMRPPRSRLRARTAYSYAPASRAPMNASSCSCSIPASSYSACSSYCPPPGIVHVCPAGGVGGCERQSSGPRVLGASRQRAPQLHQLLCGQMPIRRRRRRLARQPHAPALRRRERLLFELRAT